MKKKKEKLMNMRENYVEWTTITIQIMRMNGGQFESFAVFSGRSVINI